MVECGACGEKIAEEDAVKGYTSPGCILCVPCWRYLDDEVFSAQPGDDDV